MKRLNLLNRGILALFYFMVLLLYLSGLSCYSYNRNKNIFKRYESLKLFSIAILFLNLFYMSAVILSIVITKQINCTKEKQCYMVVLVPVLLSMFARLNHFIYENQLVELLKELFDILRDVRVVARHPNFFRFSHFVLCLLALQSMLRSAAIQLETIFDIGKHSIKDQLFIIWLALIALQIFNLLTTSNVMIFIGLIASYDELHRCTRRISNDVRTLRMAQWNMEGGQRVLLTRQLRMNLKQLIALRSRMFSITVRLIKFFRFQLSLSIIYWIGYEVMTFIAIYEFDNKSTFWHIVVGLSNIAFYCTIFEIFVWKSMLSRSFWHMHLLKLNKHFDRTVEKLLHRELMECVRVVAYGIPLNMNFFFKIFIPTIGYTLIRLVTDKHK